MVKGKVVVRDWIIARLDSIRLSGSDLLHRAREISSRGLDAGWTAVDASRQVQAELAACAALLALLYWTETNIRDLFFAVAITFALVALGASVTRRTLTPLLTTLAVVAGVAAISAKKFELLATQLHSFDIYQYVLKWENLKYVASVAPTLVIAGGLCFAGSLLILRFIWRRDRTRCPRWLSLGTFGVCVATATLVRVMSLFPDFLQGAVAGGSVSSFYLSWPQTLTAVRQGQMLEALPPGGSKKASFRIPSSCEVKDKGKLPNIILIHQESMVPPSFYPGLSYDQAVDRLFLSDDGKTHPLRVEVYGGGSWLSQLSVLTGLSTRSFGDMRFYLLNFMRDKLADTLPQHLQLCGYRTMFQSVSPGNVLSLGNFFRSIGFEKFHDRRAQGSEKFAERDSFYYDNYLRYFREHRAAGTGPLFGMIETIASHWPYDFAFMPLENVPGGGPGAHTEVHEYLRRMSMAANDFDRFLVALKKAFPGEAFLIVSYGDHRPFVNRYLQPGFDKRLSSIVREKFDFDSEPFVTYYSVRGINFTVPRLPDHGVLEAPYLPVVLLRSAGLPLSEANTERSRLMDYCNGTFASCPDKLAILEFHRRLLDGKIVRAN